MIKFWLMGWSMDLLGYKPGNVKAAARSFFFPSSWNVLTCAKVNANICSKKKVNTNIKSRSGGSQTITQSLITIFCSGIIFLFMNNFFVLLKQLKNCSGIQKNVLPCDPAAPAAPAQMGLGVDLFSVFSHFQGLSVPSGPSHDYCGPVMN